MALNTERVRVPLMHRLGDLRKSALIGSHPIEHFRKSALELSSFMTKYATKLTLKKRILRYM